MIFTALDIVSYGVGRKIESTDEFFKFSSQELYQIATKVRRFSTALSYIYEAYYISAITVKYLTNEAFTQERFIQVAKELFSLEIEHGRVVKYPESFAVPIIKDTLDYYVTNNMLEKTEDRKFRVIDNAKLDQIIEKFIHDLNDQVAINLKFNRL
jgi:hypothetical protein